MCTDDSMIGDAPNNMSFFVGRFFQWQHQREVSLQLQQIDEAANHLDLLKKPRKIYCIKIFILPKRPFSKAKKMP